MIKRRAPLLKLEAEILKNAANKPAILAAIVAQGHLSASLTRGVDRDLNHVPVRVGQTGVTAHQLCESSNLKQTWTMFVLLRTRTS